MWILGDPHEGAATANLSNRIADMEAMMPFDIGIIVGDMIRNQFCPTWQEGWNFKNQFLLTDRNKFYCLAGNHDGDPNMAWFKSWVDPTGTAPFSGVDNALRPYPVLGTDYRYRVNVGNLSMLFLSDDNSAPTPFGRDCNVSGGHPGGHVELEVYQWWISQLHEPDTIYMTFSHQGLYDTTAYTDYFEGHDEQIHGSSSTFDDKGSSMIYSIGGVLEDERLWGFNGYLQAFPGSVLGWFHGHSHRTFTPFTEFNGRGTVQVKGGTLFVNAGCVGDYPGCSDVPYSRMLEFTEGSNVVIMHTIIHEDWNGFTKGVIDTQTYTIPIKFSQA